MDAAARLALVAVRPGRVIEELKWLVAHVASRASGCRYCSAHTGYHAHHEGGAAVEKIEAVWECRRGWSRHRSRSTRPDRDPTNCCFGGDEHRTLFLTQADGGRVTVVEWDRPGMVLFPDRDRGIR